jgi:hypothetical protein
MLVVCGGSVFRCGYELTVHNHTSTQTLQEQGSDILTFYTQHKYTNFNTMYSHTLQAF